MTTKQQLENAARAMGLPQGTTSEHGHYYVEQSTGLCQKWNPLDPTKTDLQDLVLALTLDVDWSFDDESVFVSDFRIGKCGATVSIANGDKHAALAEAVVSVASQIWEGKQ
jgi:hypothetical protein